MEKSFLLILFYSASGSVKNLAHAIADGAEDQNLDIKILNSTDKKLRAKYVKFLFKKLHRNQGLLERDCDRMIRNDRVIWSSCMVECGDADAMVTGCLLYTSDAADE